MQESQVGRGRFDEPRKNPSKVLDFSKETFNEMSAFMKDAHHKSWDSFGLNERE